MQTAEGVAEVMRVLRLEGQAILECAERLQKTPAFGEAIQTALKLLHHALDQGGKIIVVGVGKSGKIAQKIAATLCSTGSLAIYLHPTDGLHGDLGVMTPNDVVLAFSYTGNTEELIQLLPSLKNLRVPVVGIGGNSQSKLAQNCDVWIDGAIEKEACPHLLAPTASTTLALALGDALAIALMQGRGFDVNAFARIHPGGALGKRLTLRVGDIMHRGDSVPTVSREASMDEVIALATKKKLGAVLVLERKKLVGIITDGDLRRALQHRERFFSLKAQEVMTFHPVTVQPEILAYTALGLMEKRSSQISVLPVIDEAGEWKGLIRLHDLFQEF